MIVTGIKQTDGIFIPFEELKKLINQEFTKIKLEITILEFKNEIVNKTAGLLSKYNLDGTEFQNTIREEWNANTL